MRRHKLHTRGVTLLEVVVAGALLLSWVGAAMTTFLSSHEVVGQSLVVADTAQMANRIEDRIIEELRSAGEMDLDDSDGDGDFDAIDYKPVAGYDFANGKAALGAQRRIEWTGNQVVLTVNGTEVGLGTRVEGPTFRFDFYQSGSNTPSGNATPDDDDDELRIRFAVTGTLGPNETHFERREVRVAIRNR